MNRIRAIQKADYSRTLGRINVPTLILTPEEDRLIGREAAQILLNGIPGSEEMVLPRPDTCFALASGAYSTAVAGSPAQGLEAGQATDRPLTLAQPNRSLLR